MGKPDCSIETYGYSHSHRSIGFTYGYSHLTPSGVTWRCCINQKDSLIINYLQFEPILVKLLLINNLAVFMPQRRVTHQLKFLTPKG